MIDEELMKELKDVSILCLEDEDGIREFVVNTLKYYFKSVYEANNVSDAYELYEYYKPKIILSDIQMKGENGIDFVKKIRQNDTNTMIIMLTAYSNEEYLMDLINLNIDHYILKPLNLKKLNSALEKYIQKNINQKIALSDELLLDNSTRKLYYNDEVIELRKKERDFLNLLHRKRDSLVTYNEIENELWQDKEMTTYALKSFIKELRAKLPINIIKNVPQEGYRLQ